MNTGSQEILGRDCTELFTGSMHSFADRLIGKGRGPMVYTIWSDVRYGSNWPEFEKIDNEDDYAFVYVGIGGTGRSGNPWHRLGTHRSGTRAGDQFCIYVQDYYILPKSDATKYVRGALDKEIGSFVQEHFHYRYMIFDSDETGLVKSIEKQIKISPGLPNPVLNGSAGW